MPVVMSDRLGSLVRRLLAAAGTPEDITDYVADSLVESNLKGVDSHGVLNLPWYLDEIAKGAVKPANRPTIESETPTSAKLRGHCGLGIYGLGQATELAVEKARAQQIATVALVDCSHTGRIGRFAEWAARRHMFAMVLGGGAYRIWSTVVPFGGAANILGTNPYAFALPGGRFGPIVVDFATSVTSGGKIAVHRSENKPVPEGWILDKHGKPTTNPADYFDGGMQLPAAGHKGYGLALIAELIGEAVLNFPPEFNWLVVVIDLGTFRPAADYAATAEAYLQKVKDVPPADGFDRVMLPGEPEFQTTRERERNGIPIPEPVWAEISEAAAKLGVAVE